jgi:hypothetical protein
MQSRCVAMEAVAECGSTAENPGFDQALIGRHPTATRPNRLSFFRYSRDYAVHKDAPRIT